MNHSSQQPASAGFALPGGSLVLTLILGFASLANAAEPVNQLTAAEKADGWRLLFDGKTTDGWRGMKKDAFPSAGWEVKDGSLHHIAKAGGGDIITTETFDQFEFSFEWKIAPGANSGVKYFIIEERGAIGHEYQVLDDEVHPDGRNGKERRTAAFYDVMSPGATRLNPPGEFNHSLIRVAGNSVEHWLNGDKVLAYTLDSPEVKAAVQDSKFSGEKIFGTRVKGHLLLQDHSDEVWFRNLKIRVP